MTIIKQRWWRWRPATLAVLVAAGGTLSCVASVDSTPDDLKLNAPMRPGFEEVADALQPSCGTLDCHGQATRNLRVFGGRGLRLAQGAKAGEGQTTPAEYDATYWAVVALEPEVMASVVAEGGAGPDRLLLMRKGRGTTRHKGGTLMRPGDDLDTCLAEWLKGNIAVDRCRAAAALSPPGPP